MTEQIHPDAMDLLRRMIRLEACGMNDISHARRRTPTRSTYIPMEAVLWCHDRGWLELTRSAFEVVDWSYFRVTAAGYAALGAPQPPWK
jgi:hypothetical protein